MAVQFDEVTADIERPRAEQAAESAPASEAPKKASPWMQCECEHKERRQRRLTAH